jgi:hypothetical protein
VEAVVISMGDPKRLIGELEVGEMAEGVGLAEDGCGMPDGFGANGLVPKAGLGAESVGFCGTGAENGEGKEDCGAAEGGLLVGAEGCDCKLSLPVEGGVEEDANGGVLVDEKGVCDLAAELGAAWLDDGWLFPKGVGVGADVEVVLLNGEVEPNGLGICAFSAALPRDGVKIELAGLPKGVDDAATFGVSLEGAAAKGLAKGFGEAESLFDEAAKGEAEAACEVDGMATVYRVSTSFAWLHQLRDKMPLLLSSYM